VEPQINQVAAKQSISLGGNPGTVLSGKVVEFMADMLGISAPLQHGRIKAISMNSINFKGS
jgi:hypothetical protein